jgi:hypothetical protein
MTWLFSLNGKLTDRETIGNHYPGEGLEISAANIFSPQGRDSVGHGHQRAVKRKKASRGAEIRVVAQSFLPEGPGCRLGIRRLL